ncbi:MAG: cysteine desulfurase [Alphaproteobacteria bacterium]|nr:cysteine desulfurase [Alphaproteobacteria bacterium]
MSPVYLDHNATSPPRPEALEVALPLITEHWGNPASTHQAARRPAAAVEVARGQVARWCGARPRDVIFTSGATEANHLALRGALGGGRLVVSAVEHPSVRAPGLALGASVAPVDADGVVDLDALDALLTPDVRLVSVMAANNETGVIQPLTAIHARVHAAGALLHVDAAQLPGRLPAPQAWDLLTLTAHKAGGLKGAGALVLRPGVALTPQQLGGPQERERRAGTVNAAPIAALGAILDLPIPGHLGALQDRLAEGLSGLGAVVTAASRARLPNTVHVRFPGIPGDSIVMGLDLTGVQVSVGAACASGAARPSHVLAAMGLPPGEGVRMSLGWNTEKGEIDRAVHATRRVLAQHEAASEVI